MTKRIRKLAAAVAAGALALTQISAVIPAVSADNMWDQPWLGNWFNPTESSEETTEAAASGTSAAVQTTVTTAAVSTTETTATTKKPSIMDLIFPWIGGETTTETTTTAAATTATSSATTSTAASMTKPAVTVTESRPAMTAAATTTATTLTTSVAGTTGTTAETLTTVTEPAATEPTETPSGFSMPEDPDMPDFSALGAIGNLTQMQTEYIARSVFKCCKNPDAYPHNVENGVEGNKRVISLDYEELGVFQADPEGLQADETYQSIKNVIYTVIYNYKECMLSDLSIACNFRLDSNRQHESIIDFRLSFFVPDKLYADSYKRAQKQFDAVSMLADKDWTDIEKALFFHDYISVHYNYDYESADEESNGNYSHFAYGLLTEKCGVCQAYAWLYNLLLNENGVKSYFVTALVPEPDSDPEDPTYQLNHAWNLVYIDGHYYHVDVTWSDQGTGVQPHQSPEAGRPGDWLLGFAGQVGHDQFLRSTEGLRSSDSQYVGSSECWTTTIGESAYDLADSDLLDTGFWRDAKSAVTPYLGGWLVKNYDPAEKSKNKERAVYNLYTRDADGDYTATQLFVEQSPWNGKLLIKGGTATKAYAVDNMSTYCRTGKIIIYTVDGGTGLRFAYCTDENNIAASMADRWLISGFEYGLDPDERIYGLSVEDDTLKLFTALSPSDAPVEIDIPMDEIRTRMGMTTSDELPDSQEVLNIPGDVSGDGELDVLDAVCMTRYLLASKPAADADTRQRMDLIPDDVIDVYDLAKLKWLLIHMK